MKILQVAEVAAVQLVLVDAKDSAKTFYGQFGFLELEREENTLILPVATIRKAAGL